MGKTWIGVGLDGRVCDPRLVVIEDLEQAARVVLSAPKSPVTTGLRAIWVAGWRPIIELGSCGEAIASACRPEFLSCYRHDVGDWVVTASRTDPTAAIAAVIAQMVVLLRQEIEREPFVQPTAEVANVSVV